MPYDELISNIDKIRTTKLGAERVKQNLGLEIDDVADWCRQKIGQSSEIIRTGKNWYVYADNSVITVNAQSCTLITAHRITATEPIADGFSPTAMEEAYEVTLSMIHKPERAREKLRAGTSQRTQLDRRLGALRLAMSLITRELKKGSG